MRFSKSEDMVEYLRGKTAKAIQEGMGPGDMFHPVLDNDLLKEPHILSCKNDKSAHIPYILGCNNSEGAILVSMVFGFKIPDREACTNAIKFIISLLVNASKVDVDGMVASIRQEYTTGCSEEEVIQRVVELMGDSMFVYPTVLAADAHCSK